MSVAGIEVIRSTTNGCANVILATTRGPGPARNAGVAASSGTLLAFTDTDCKPDPSWLANGLQALDSFDVVGGKMQVTVETSERPTPVESFEKVFAFRNRSYIKKEGYTVTANLFTKRSVFDRIGGFAATTVAEDKEWCRRATTAGFTLGYSSKALVLHPARRDLAELKKKWKRILLQQYNEVQVQSYPKFRWLAFNLIVLLSPGLHIFTVLQSDCLSSWTERLAAISVLIRLRLWRFSEGIRLLWAGPAGDPWG